MSLARFAVIGRDAPGKGIRETIEVFSELPNELHVFSDYLGFTTENIILHGWLEPQQVWQNKFDCVILPMSAPETYSFVLHEAVFNKRPILINGRNVSLNVQVRSGALVFVGMEDLLRKVNLINRGSITFKQAQLIKRRSLWERLK